VKGKRQKKILEIIESNIIETQSALAESLAQAGIPSTQATVSRDIRELGLTKEQTDEGSYRYSAPQGKSIVGYNERLRTIFKESVTGIAVAQNLVVLHTLPGLAPAACLAVDSMDCDSLVGTIAGDDTAFLAMTDNQSAEQLCREVTEML